MTRALSLDVGNVTGWALAESGKITRSGARDFTVRKGEHIGHKGIKFYNFLVSLGPVDELYFEKPQFTGQRPGGGSWQGDGGELQKGLLMLVHMHCAGLGIQPVGVHPSTLKKAFSGNGRADKEDMCKIAHQMGWRGGTQGTSRGHDEVDAIALIVTQQRLLHGVEVGF